jgi:hypothetical protein
MKIPQKEQRSENVKGMGHMTDLGVNGRII